MVKRDDFGDGDAGIYRGEAYQCEILYRPVAGLSRNRLAALAEANSNGEVAYKVWMAPVASAAFGRTIHLPVGTVGSYKGNEFYMILADANISGQPLNAQSSTGD